MPMPLVCMFAMLLSYATTRDTHSIHDRPFSHIFPVKISVTYFFRSWKNVFFWGGLQIFMQNFLLPSVDQKIVQLNFFSAMCEHKRGWWDPSGHTNYISLLIQNHAVEVSLIEEISIEEFKVHLTAKCFIRFYSILLNLYSMTPQRFLGRKFWCQVFVLSVKFQAAVFFGFVVQSSVGSDPLSCILRAPPLCMQHH